METISFVRDKFGVSILLIEHDMNLVMGICEKIVVLDYGMVIASGTPVSYTHLIAIIFSAVYQALGHGFLSMALSIIRQLLVILPAAYILKSVFGGPAVWFAFPLSEIVATTISIFLYRYIYKTVIQPLGNSKEASIL